MKRHFSCASVLFGALYAISFLTSCSSAEITNVSVKKEESESTQFFSYTKNDSLDISADSILLSDNSGILKTDDKRNDLFEKQVVSVLEERKTFFRVKSDDDSSSEDKKTKLDKTYNVDIYIKELTPDKSKSVGDIATFVLTMGFGPLKTYTKFFCDIKITEQKTGKTIEIKRIYNIEYETLDTLPTQHADNINFYIGMFRKMWLPIFDSIMISKN